MNFTNALLGILPLLVFVIADSFLGPKKALVFAIVLGVVEAAYTLYAFGELDIVTGASVSLLIIMAIISFTKKDTIYFKFQPVILSIAFGTFLLYSFFNGEPFFLILIDKYRHLVPEQQRFALDLPRVRENYKNLTMVFGYGLFIHAFITGFAALKLNNWWWIILRGVGFYGIMFISWIVSLLI